MSGAQQVDVLLAGVYDDVGDPLSGGKIYTYLAGTTTPSALWAARDKSSYATNPIILDANGRAKVWAEGSYKFVIKTSADVSVDTFDNLVYGVSDKDMIWAGLSTGSSSVYVLSPVPAMTEYENGHYTSFVANHSNSGATTLNISGLGALTVKTGVGADLSGGEIVSGNIVTVVYDSASGYFILDSSTNFSSITVSGAGTFGSVVSPILQSAGAIAIKPSGVGKWDFLSGGSLVPTSNNDVDLGSSSLRIKAGYFVALNTPEVVSSSGSALTVHSASGSALAFGDGANSWLVSSGNLFPGVSNSYDLGGGSWLIKCGYFTKVETASSVSPSGDAYIFGSGSNDWQVDTTGRLWPYATTGTIDLGKSDRRIKDIYINGQINKTGISYSFSGTDAYSAVRSINWNAVTSGTGTDSVNKTTLDSILLSLARAIATLWKDYYGAT